MVKVTVILPNTIAALLKRYSKFLNRSQSWLVKHALLNDLTGASR